MASCAIEFAESRRRDRSEGSKSKIKYRGKSFSVDSKFRDEFIEQFAAIVEVARYNFTSKFFSIQVFNMEQHFTTCKKFMALFKKVTGKGRVFFSFDVFFYSD